MRRFLAPWLLPLFAAMLLVEPVAARAAIPQLISYQGYLSATDGAPVNKTVTLQLALYDLATGGTPFWTEQQVVAVAGGQFSVNLGSVTPFNHPFDKPYFLGVKVDGDQEMVPRQAFTSSPYALRSAIAEAVVDGSVATAGLQDGSVTATKLGITCGLGQVLTRTTSGWGCGTASTGGGTLTGIIAGSGIAVSGSAISPQIEVSFAGNGSALSAARSDHDHDALYQKKYGKVAVVALSGGGYTTPAAALAEVATWCGAPSAVNPCLVKIMPGVYDLGNTPLSLVAYVDVDGSGESNTCLTGSVDAATSGLVIGANATLSMLTVRNDGGGNAQNAVAIFNKAATLRLRNVTARATGASNTFAALNSGTGVVDIASCYLDAAGLTIFNDARATGRVFATTFNGGTVRNAGTLACSSSRDGKNTFFPSNCPPFQALQVTAYQPVSGGAANALVKAQFNNGIDPSTPTGASFTVQDAGTGNYLSGSVQYDAGSNSAIFTPVGAMTGSVQATVTTAVRDLSGGRLAAPYSWTFWVGSGMVDNKPPVVLSVIPLDKSAGVQSGTQISAGFDKTLDGLVNASGMLTLVDANGSAVKGKVQAAGSQVVFVPDAPLSWGTTYTATVGGARDVSGNTQSSPCGWSFTTAPLAPPGGVSATAGGTGATVTWLPAPGATSYNVYWSTAAFSPQGVSGSTAGSASGSVAAKLVFSSSGQDLYSMTPVKVTGATSPYSFTPPPLPFTGTLTLVASGAGADKLAGEELTLTVPAGVTVVNVSSPGAISTFSQTSPTQVRIAGTSNTLGSPGPLTVQCSGDFTGKSLADFGAANTQFVDSAGSMLSGVTLSITPSGTGGAAYYFAVSALNAGGESSLSSVVTAIIDPLPPILTYYAPTGANANLPAQIFAGFSETVDLSSVTAASFRVTTNGAPVAGTFSQGSDCGQTACFNGILFNPTLPLGQGTGYTVSLSGIKDLAGNALQIPFTWSFTTGIASPTGVTAVGGDLQATVSWQPVAGATSYNIYWSTSYDVSPQNGIKISGITGTSYVHTGLANGATYYYVVTAVTGGNEGAPSDRASVQIDTTGLQVTSTSPVNDAAGVLLTPQICVSFTKGISYDSWSAANVVVTDATGAAIAGSYSQTCFTPTAPLGVGTRHTVTIGTGVRDYYGNFLAAPFVFKFTTVPVGAPAQLFATRGNLQANLAWTQVAGATGYNVYWSTAYGVTPQNGNKIGGISAASYAHTGLNNGSTYYYVVTALNGAAEGPASGQASVTIDNLAPAVTSTTPSNNATGVPTGNSVCVNFNKQIDGSTFNNVNVTLKDASGTAVNGNWWYQCISGAALAYNTKYTVTVGTGVQDDNGNNLPAPYSFSFTTVAVGPPGYLSATRGNLQSSLVWTPAAGATGYNVYWSTSYNVSPLSGTKISGVSGTSYTHTGLANGTTYYYLVTSVNGSGESLPSNSAQVTIDTVAPVITSTTPAAGAVGAATYTTVCANFNKSMNSSSWNNVNVSLKDVNGAAVSGDFFGTCISPNQALGFNTTYTLSIGTGVQDSSGNALAAPYSFSFTTVQAAPAGLAASAGALQATLSWPAVANAGSYNLYWANQAGVTTGNSVKVGGITATSYLHASLASGSVYYYRIAAVVGGVESPLSNEVRLSFDSTPATITSTSPVNGSANVNNNSVYIYFSEPVDSSSVTGATVVVTTGSSAVNGNTYSSGNQVYWYGNDSLNLGTTYSATVSGVKDLSGNLTPPYTFSWTTRGLDPPTATATAGDPGSNRIVVSWPQVSGAAMYNIYWSTGAGITRANGTRIVGAGSPFVHTGLNAGTTYRYLVTAATGSIESAPSAQVSAVAP